MRFMVNISINIRMDTDLKRQFGKRKIIRRIVLP